MNKKLFPMLVIITLILLFTWTFVPQNAYAAVPGLPFTEDFTDTALRDADKTNANWSTDEEALILNWRQAQYGVFDPSLAGSDISIDTHLTYFVGLGDVDGDGDLDLVAGNNGTNRLYLNNGTADPFHEVAGLDISSDTHETHAVGLGDVDGDGNLDLVTGDYNQANRLYLNNGTADPFSGVAGSDISSDAHKTNFIAMGDVDGDGDLDLLAGNYTEINRLYLNNGSSDPFSGVVGSDVTSDANGTNSIGLADVDGDGNLDLVAGNYGQRNRLYLNNGTAAPFSGVAGSDISIDTHMTTSIRLGDVDGDGALDLLAGNYSQTNRLYLNNGGADPFSGVTGSDISSDAHDTWFIELGDVDGDGDLDMLTGNSGQTTCLYLNNGSSDPFSGVSGSDISSDTYQTMSIGLGDVDGDGDLDLLAGTYSLSNPDRLYLNNGSASPFSAVTGSDVCSDAYNTYSIGLGDVDGNGDLDLVTGNAGQNNRLYLQRNSYDTTRRLATSLRVDAESSNITQATLTASADLPINTSAMYYLSNNGGARWYIVQPGVEFTFPTTGMDLRWKVELDSLSPTLTPKINQIQIDLGDYYNYLPLIFK